MKIKRRHLWISEDLRRNYMEEALLAWVSFVLLKMKLNDFERNLTLDCIISVLCRLKRFEKQIDTVEIRSSQMHMPARQVMNPVLQGQMRPGFIKESQIKEKLGIVTGKKHGICNKNAKILEAAPQA
ncbi:hypothetical protein DUI87_10469 [Hirundo rustica rustica]|uniref:Uncharacterized protein n=1 Tax=Hirundo rustica rustica TaxID=333673 RepID=A0A3M0KI86_HIRRU|nr:hypothetical protein DUI87_10469 [Hirundo rustica rustica]